MNNIQFIIKDYHYGRLGIGNILKCLISSLSINNDTVIQCYDDYMYGKYDTVLDDRFIYKNNTTKEIEKVYTCRLLILKEEEQYQQDLPSEEWYLGGLENPRFHSHFSFSKRIDWNYNPNLLHSQVKNRIFNSIDKIIFKDIILNKVQSFEELLKNKISLGISVRTWKSSHESNINRPYHFDIYKNKIIEILQQHNNINNIVLSLDNHDVYQEYSNLFKELNIDHILLTKSDELNDIQYAVTKALVLSKCNYFIGNRISTFSELVFWFSKCTIDVYTVF